MRKDLAPQKWPHFMEKTHKPLSKQYHSSKILGQLYDKVESVHFVPQYKEPFDKRILRAFQLDNAVLKAARQVKTKYDIAMRRILAQQDIKSEFEVWSTFILSKPKVGSDYKLQEEMAVITGALKDRFRLVCIEAAGGKDFSILGPFVAAMYKVTKEELDIALAECEAKRVVNGMEVPKRQMRPDTMPLISFPWLFEKELGRIATGIEATDDFEKIGFNTFSINKPQPTASRRPTELPKQEEDFVKQEDGIVIHRGEVLDLFQDDDEDNDYQWDGDQSDVESTTSTPVLATPSHPKPENETDYTNVQDSKDASKLKDTVFSSTSGNLQDQTTAISETKELDSVIATEFDYVETPTPSSSAQSFSPPVLVTKADTESLSDDEEIEEIVENLVLEPSMLDRLSAFVD